MKRSHVCGELVSASLDETIIRAIKMTNDGDYEIITDHKTGFIINHKYLTQPPEVGDKIVFYTIRVSKVVGIDLNGKELYFLDDDDVYKQ